MLENIGLLLDHTIDDTTTHIEVHNVCVAAGSAIDGCSDIVLDDGRPFSSSSKEHSLVTWQIVANSCVDKSTPLTLTSGVTVTNNNYTVEHAFSEVLYITAWQWRYQTLSCLV